MIEDGSAARPQLALKVRYVVDFSVGAEEASIRKSDDSDLQSHTYILLDLTMNVDGSVARPQLAPKAWAYSNLNQIQ